MLRCKFRLQSVTRDGSGRQVSLTASNAKDGDNQDWSKYTPSGELKFYVTNDAAWPKIDAMKPGDHFYIDIQPVESV